MTGLFRVVGGVGWSGWSDCRPPQPSIYKAFRSAMFSTKKVKDILTMGLNGIIITIFFSDVQQTKRRNNFINLTL